MSTVEREWADEHPRGRTTTNPGPMFSFWNFDINEADVKPAHAAFVREYAFTRFLVQNLNVGRRITVIGCSSTSTGNSVLNNRLARQRAVNMMLVIYRYAIILRQRGRLDASVSDAALGQLIRFETRPGTAGNTFFTRGAGGGRRGEANPMIPLGEGVNMAFNRAVNVEATPIGRLTREQIEVIGRNHLRARFSRLARGYFPFWEMWIPDWTSYKTTIPATLNRGNNIGTNIPPSRSWSGFRDASSAVQAAGVISINLDGVLNRFFYQPTEVQQEINNFLQAGVRVKSQIEAEEIHIINNLGASPGFGSIPSIDEINRYVAFRNQVVLNRTDSILRYNGFQPRLVP